MCTQKLSHICMHVCMHTHTQIHAYGTCTCKHTCFVGQVKSSLTLQTSDPSRSIFLASKSYGRNQNRIRQNWSWQQTKMIMVELSAWKTLLFFQLLKTNWERELGKNVIEWWIRRSGNWCATRGVDELDQGSLLQHFLHHQGLGYSSL